MCGDAAVNQRVDGERVQALAIELPQQVLQPAVTEGCAGWVLRLDHSVGIPDHEITGLQPAALDAHSRCQAASDRVAAADQRVQLDRLRTPFGSAARPGRAGACDRGVRGWWAPCVWCAMGIVALAAPDATIHARYGGEGEAAMLDARSDACVHFPIPARDAWNNVAYWCATVQPFRRAEDVPAWCTRHALPHGAVVPIAQVAALGRAWYGRHAARDWRKWTVAEARAIFDGVGLVGPHWELPASDTRF